MKGVDHHSKVTLVEFNPKFLQIHVNYALKDEYDSVSDEMGSIYYKGFSEEEITRFDHRKFRTTERLTAIVEIGRAHV